VELDPETLAALMEDRSRAEALARMEAGMDLPLGVFVFSHWADGA
jgi:hypothetical protein